AASAGTSRGCRGWPGTTAARAPPSRPAGRRRRAPAALPTRARTARSREPELELRVLGEAGDADADEPQRPRPVAQRAVEEAARELADPLRVVGAGGQRRRARPDREVGIAELRRDGTRRLAAAAQVLGEPLGHEAKLLVQP